MRRPSFQLFAVSAIVVFFTACATTGPPLPPSLDLPKPPGDLRAARKGERVLLTWTIPTMTTDRQRARSFGATRICRAVNAELTDCGTPAGEITIATPPPSNSGEKPAASYTDALAPALQSDDPSSFATYAVEVRNADGRSAGLSNQVRIPLVRTLPPPRDLAAHVIKEGIALSWTNNAPTAQPNSPIHYVYRVYRHEPDSTQRVLVRDLNTSSQPTIRLTDSNVEWQKTYVYSTATVTIAALGRLRGCGTRVEDKGENRDTAFIDCVDEAHVEGDDSPEVKVFADDIFPPAIPSGLQAVFSGPGQKPFVDLIWAPVPDVDLDGYNVYRRDENSQPVKLNAAPIKTAAYRDTDVVSGKYFYSVSAVDVRGNESARSEETEESVP